MDTRYRYRARNKQSEVLTGIVEAASLESAERILADNGLSVLSLEKTKNWREVLGFGQKIRLKQKAFVARQLATMVNAGLPLPQALGLLIRSERSQAVSRALSDVQRDLEAGFSFSTAISKQPELFSRVFVNAVRAGEATGKLELVLEELSTTLENDSAASNRFRSLMIYPIFIVVAMIGVGGLMMVKVIPVLANVFAEAKTELPWATRGLIAISAAVQSYWWLLIILVAILTVALRGWSQTDRGREIFDLLKLRAPGYKKVSQMFYMARFSRTLAMLINAGVPLLEAIKITADAIDNVILKRTLEQSSFQVERGVPLSATLQKSTYFPALVTQMILTGEQTGELDKVLSRVSATYEEEYDTVVKSAATLIEPVIVVVLGLAVAFLVFAVIIPIYQVSLLQ
jgi:type II secretory pathway component PulF